MHVPRRSTRGSSTTRTRSSWPVSAARWASGPRPVDRTPNVVPVESRIPILRERDSDAVFPVLKNLPPWQGGEQCLSRPLPVVQVVIACSDNDVRSYCAPKVFGVVNRRGSFESVWRVWGCRSGGRRTLPYGRGSVVLQTASLLLWPCCVADRFLTVAALFRYGRHVDRPLPRGHQWAWRAGFDDRTKRSPTAHECFTGGI